MGAKVSAEMLKARELILKGVNPAEAARRCGLTRSAVYHSQWYKDRQNDKSNDSNSDNLRDAS